MTISSTPSMTRQRLTRAVARAVAFATALAMAAPAMAQTRPPQTAAPQTKPATPQTGQPATGQPAPSQPGSSQPAGSIQGAAAPPDYVIGVDDVLTVTFWREKDLNADVTVRPDGMISLALINDIRAAGLTTLQLRTALMEAARKYVTDASLTVSVKQINSRKVYVTGQVNKPGTYPLTDTMTVLQMLAVAGGLMEFASGENVLIMRIENGQTKSYKFNYKDVRKGKNLQQNIALKPGDTIVVP